LIRGKGRARDQGAAGSGGDEAQAIKAPCLPAARGVPPLALGQTTGRSSWPPDTRDKGHGMKHLAGLQAVISTNIFYFFVFLAIFSLWAAKGLRREQHGLTKAPSCSTRLADSGMLAGAAGHTAFMKYAD